MTKPLGGQHVTRRLTILHSFDAFLPTTENWIYRLLKYSERSSVIIATDRILESEFDLPSSTKLRSPLQPRLWENQRVTFWLRLRKLLCRITYTTFAGWQLRRTRVDLMHSHFAQVGWRFRNLAPRLDVAHVVSLYGWDYVSLAASRPKWRSRLEQLYGMVDAFICEGPHGAALLAHNGCPMHRIHVCRLGVEPGEIPFFTRRKRSRSLRLLQVASFREKKGHVDTVTAFADALQRCPNMHLTLIGATPGLVYDKIRALVSAKRITDRVTLQPGVKFDDLHSVMRDFDVFIHPSRHAADGDCEGGAPVVLLDAQATGLPVISTTHCDIPQEVVDGETGRLCAEGDTQCLARAIECFYLMGEEDYEHFSTAARRHIEANFDARVCAARLELVYRDIVAARRRH